MRESIGGTWLFGIVAVFISLFTAFLAYSISYTRAFNTKNQIISIIEENEGYTVYPENDDLKNMTLDELNNITGESRTTDVQIMAAIKNTGYNYTAPEGIDCLQLDHLPNELLTQKDSKYTPTVGGYCITKMCPDGNNGYLYDAVTGRYKGRTYYKVTTFIAIKIPILEMTVKIPISGETETLYYDQTGFTKCPTNN